MKQVFNSMMFVTAPLSRMPRGVRGSFSNGVTIQTVTEGIVSAHPALANHFHTGIGHHIQFIESQIMVRLLQDLRGQGIVALPVHDAVVVPLSKKAPATEAMLSVFHQLSGTVGDVKEEV